MAIKAGAVEVALEVVPSVSGAGFLRHAAQRLCEEADRLDGATSEVVVTRKRTWDTPEVTP